MTEKEKYITLAKNYIYIHRNFINKENFEQYQDWIFLHEYIFKKVIFDLFKYIKNDVVEFDVNCDIVGKYEKVNLTLDEYLNSDLFKI